MWLATLRAAQLGCLALSLSACGVVPPMVSLVSYAADGLSLLSTGKSLTDHALSAAVERDCALFRVFSTGEICRDYTQTAAAGSEPGLIWSDVEPSAGAGVDRGGNAKPATAALGGVGRSAAGDRHYLVLASFREARPAEQLAAAHPELGATAREADVAGKRWYRVVVGPASLAELEPVQRRLGGLGMERPWLVRAEAQLDPPKFATLALQLSQSR
jgi:hypothetical protein